MTKYQVYFDTVSGETKYNVDIDEGETLDMVLEEILFDLREHGDMLKGNGEPEVVWNGKRWILPCPSVRRVWPQQRAARSTVASHG